MAANRLAPKERLILELLASGPAYGLEMVARSRGRLARGTVYVVLARMAEKGFVTAAESASTTGGPPRRIYRATARGARMLQAWQAYERAAGER